MEEPISIQLGHFLDTANGTFVLNTPGTTDFACRLFPTVVWLAAAIRVPLGENTAYRPQLTALLVDAQGRPTMRPGAKTWTPRTGWHEEERTALIYGFINALAQEPGEYTLIAYLNAQEAGRLLIQITQGH